MHRMYGPEYHQGHVIRLPFRTRELPVGAELKLPVGSFLCPADPDDVLATITDENYRKDQFLPYWAEQWPSSPALLSYIVKHPPEGACLELGCGLGIITAVLSRTNDPAIALDIAPDACKFAYVNISRMTSHPKVVCCDWRSLPFNKRFDTIIASDVLYEERWVDPVVGCIENMLAPGGIAIIADPLRKSWPLFKEKISDRGYKLKTNIKKEVNGGKTIVEVITLWR